MASIWTLAGAYSLAGSWIVICCCDGILDDDAFLIGQDAAIAQVQYLSIDTKPVTDVSFRCFQQLES